MKNCVHCGQKIHIWVDKEVYQWRHVTTNLKSCGFRYNTLAQPKK